MRRILLDMSGLIGVAQTALQYFRDLELVLIGTFFIELYTHTGKGKPYSKVRASAKAYEYMSKVGSVVPFIQFVDAPIRFEIEHGHPASAASRRKLIIPESAPILPEKELQDMLANENAMGELGRFSHPLACEQAYQSIRRLREDKDLWPRLAVLFQDTNTVEAIRKETVERAHSIATQHGWSVHETFVPDIGWYTFGFVLAEFAFMMWKYARYGDGIPQPSNPANPTYDMTYVAHMAICDGILSCDKALLNMAWTCWPDKRENIFTYNTKEKRVITYNPDWEN